MEHAVLTTSEGQTRGLAAAVAPLLMPGDVVALIGMLGAGKTCFVRGLAEGLGAESAALVKSPSFVLINEYPTRPVLYHVDAYRLRGPAELQMVGIDDYFSAGGICVVEWADRVYNLLPDVHLVVIIELADRESRVLRFAWKGLSDRNRAADFDAALAAFSKKLQA